MPSSHLTASGTPFQSVHQPIGSPPGVGCPPGSAFGLALQAATPSRLVDIAVRRPPARVLWCAAPWCGVKARRPGWTYVNDPTPIKPCNDQHDAW